MMWNSLMVKDYFWSENEEGIWNNSVEVEDLIYLVSKRVDVLSPANDEPISLKLLDWKTYTPWELLRTVEWILQNGGMVSFMLLKWYMNNASPWFTWDDYDALEEINLLY